MSRDWSTCAVCSCCADRIDARARLERERVRLALLEAARRLGGVAAAAVEAVAEAFREGP